MRINLLFFWNSYYFFMILDFILSIWNDSMSRYIGTFLDWNNFLRSHDVMSSIRGLIRLFEYSRSREFLCLLNRRLLLWLSWRDGWFWNSYYFFMVLNFILSIRNNSMSGYIGTFFYWNNFLWCHDVMSTVTGFKSLFNYFRTSEFWRLLNIRFLLWWWNLRIIKLTWWLLLWRLSWLYVKSTAVW